MQSQGSAFMEAVEQLASEAGLSVPKPTPEAAQAERHRLDLNAVLEAAPPPTSAASICRKGGRRCPTSRPAA
jgi:hypothetical protein